jgi:predicted transporter
MDSAALIVIGILIGILIFGIKSGIGCGFSKVTTREILTIAGSYFFLALLFGSIADRINLEALRGLSSMGMGIHAFVSLLLITTGIYTQKKWNSGKDVSRHTFLVLSLPCPVCLGALAVSCILLASTLEINGLKIGFLVGSAFFIAIVGSSFLFRKLGKTPDTLGGIMMMLGIYYMLGLLLIPAYMQTKPMSVSSSGRDEIAMIPLLVCGAIVLVSFLLANTRRHNQ